MQVHEAKLRKFPPFCEAGERFVAALATHLKPEIYLPEAYVLVAGQVSHSIYFITRGEVQVTWQADQVNIVNLISVDDYFGELGLFVKNKLAYTVRAITHLDAFRLDRLDFEAVMRDHPAGALHVADQLPKVLPEYMATRVIGEIYDYAGLRELLSGLAGGPRRWRPPKGTAQRIRRLVKTPYFVKLHSTRIGRRSGVGSNPAVGSPGSSLRLSNRASRLSGELAAEGGAGESGSGRGETDAEPSSTPQTGEPGGRERGVLHGLLDRDAEEDPDGVHEISMRRPRAGSEGGDGAAGAALGELCEAVQREVRALGEAQLGLERSQRSLEQEVTVSQRRLETKLDRLIDQMVPMLRLVTDGGYVPTAAPAAAPLPTTQL